MQELILIGGGGHCKSSIDVIEQTGNFSIVAIVDVQEKVGTEISGYQINYIDSDLKVLIEKHKNVLITLGQIKSPLLRQKYFKLCKEFGAVFPPIVSPRAYVAKTAKIEEGTIVLHDALVNAGAKIGKNCIINTKSLVEHDAIIEDHCHVSTAAVLNGEVRMCEGSFLGSNAIVAERVQIPAGSVISAGTFLKRI